jgi:hypothetical protein
VIILLDIERLHLSRQGGIFALAQFIYDLADILEYHYGEMPGTRTIFAILHRANELVPQVAEPVLKF